jgi:hypothetical protein
MAVLKAVERRVVSEKMVVSFILVDWGSILDVETRGALTLIAFVWEKRKGTVYIVFELHTLMALLRGRSMKLHSLGPPDINHRHNRRCKRARSMLMLPIILLNQEQSISIADRSAK